MIVRTDTGYPNTYAGMGSYGIPRRAFGLGEIDEETGLSINEGLPTGVFTSVSDDPFGTTISFPQYGPAGGEPNFFPQGTPAAGGSGVTQDANGNWLDASGKPTNFNASNAPGSTNYVPSAGVLSNLLNTLAITTPAIVASVNGAAISTAQQCASAGGQWTGANCVKQTTNTTTLLMYAVGAGALLLILSKRGR